MKAVILAAGEGRRLEPLTRVRPKPMLPISNRPLLEYVIEAVVGAGIGEIVLVVGYKRERIQNYFGDGDDWDVTIEYAVQEKQLGTGHAILQAEPYVDGDFLALNGDRILKASIVERLSTELGASDQTLVAVSRSDRPSDYGVVAVDGNRVVDITEKPPGHATVSNIINAGVYGFHQNIFDEIRVTEADGELTITAALKRLVEGGTVRAVRYPGMWLDVSYLWDVIGVNAGVIDQFGPDRAPAVRVHDQAVVSDAAAIGQDTAIQPNATVLRGTSLGDNVSVGPNAVVSNSVILPDATIEAGAVVQDCIVGENAHVGPHVTIEGGRAAVVIDETVYSDVLLGGVVGDNAYLGGSVTVAPGTVIGNEAVVTSGAALDGRIPANAEVRRG